MDTKSKKKPVCRPFTVDPHSDDREAVIWILQSGGPDNEDHPVRRRERAVRGLPIRARACAARDMLKREDHDHQLELVIKVTRDRTWSLAYASFLLHGFEVPEAEADLAVEFLRQHRARNQLIEAIVRAFDQLTVDLKPLNRAAPSDVLYVVATWPEDLRPRNPFFAWQALDHLLEQNRVLTEELEAARSRWIAPIAKAIHGAKGRAIKEARTIRAEIYLAVLAKEHFRDLQGNTSAMAEKLIELVARGIGGNEIGQGKSQVLLSKQQISKTLEDGWKAAAMPGGDRKKGPKTRLPDKPD